jgi:putative membrane protein
MNGKNHMEDQNPLSLDDLLAIERTKLAMERTKLANERTLLSFVRTSLTFFAASATLLQFFEHQNFVIVGYITFPLGVILLLTGFYSFYRAKKVMKEMELVK